MVDRTWESLLEAFAAIYIRYNIKISPSTRLADASRGLCFEEGLGPIGSC